MENKTNISTANVEVDVEKTENWLRLQDLAVELREAIAEKSNSQSDVLEINVTHNEYCIILSGGWYIFHIQRIFAWAIEKDAFADVSVDDEYRPMIKLFV